MGRDGVIDVMRDAAGHLAECTQALLLHHRLLALPELVVCLLQRCVELRLVCGERYVIAQLPQELALVAGEAFRFSARSEQHAEDSALGEERRDHQGAQPCIHETLRKLAGGARDVRLVDELPSDACRQAVAVDADVLVLLHRELLVTVSLREPILVTVSTRSAST
jgi:hypothetical protein